MSCRFGFASSRSNSSTRKYAFDDLRDGAFGRRQGELSELRGRRAQHPDRTARRWRRAAALCDQGIKTSPKCQRESTADKESMHAAGALSVDRQFSRFAAS